MTPHTYYIDAAHGDDTHDGLSPARPLRSNASLEICPGDTVLFKRGSVIRGPLQTRDGNEGALVTYGAYGDGEKPIFLGSIPIGDPNLWIQERPSIWRYRDALPSEVCNLVFNEGESCGILRWTPEDLRLPGDWHYTRIGATSAGESWGGSGWCDGILYLCSVENPGHAWRDIECVLWGARKLIGGRRHMILENLSFRNSGVHGFQDCDVRNVTIRHCDFRFIGGAVWHRERRIRFGNAIELWDGAWDITVERCTFDVIYDSGVTHQGGETRNIPARLYFTDNRFTDCGIAAYECREPSAEVYFVRNACIITGGGFGLQGEVPPRQSEIYPQPMGHHVFIWRIEPDTQPGRVHIRDNAFSEAPHGAAIYSIIDPLDERLFVLDRNVYEGSPDALLVRWSGRDYRVKDFDCYRVETGQDAHSRVCPKTVNVAGGVTVSAAIAGDGVRGGRIIACSDAAWHSQQLEEPCILENPKDPSRLVMFYSGVPSSNTSVCHIGKAWALKSDPFTWHQDPGNPVFSQAASGWDSASIRLDCVLYVQEEDAYYIYYSGTDVADAQNRIGLAICPAGDDGYSGISASSIRRHGSAPVLAPEPAEPFAETMSSQAAVWRERDEAGQWHWYLYYSYRGGNGVLPGIRLATSTDGKNWQRHYNQDDSRGMGHLFVSTPDAYYEWHQVFKVDDTYVLSMEVGPNRGERWRPVLAVSRHPDRGWEQLDVDTVLQTRWPGIYSDETMFHVATPTFYQIDGRWFLYVQACPLPTSRNYIDGRWDLWAFACDRRIPTRHGLTDLFIPGKSTAVKL
jgi:hypothetical protein